MGRREFIFTVTLVLSLVSFLGVRDIYSDAVFLLPILPLYLIALYSKQPELQFVQRLWLGSWLFICLFSVLWAEWKSSALWFGMILGLVPLSLLFFSDYLSRREVWEIVRRSMFFIFLLLSVWMVLEFWVAGGRSSGPMIDANVAGSLMAVGLIYLGSMLIFSAIEAKYSLLISGVYFLFSVALFSSGSRGALVSLLLISVLGFFLLISIRAKPHLKKAVMISALTVLAFLVVSSRSDNFSVYDRVSQADTYLDESVNARLYLINSGFELYQESPLLGWGIGSFKVIYPSVRSRSERESAGDFLHNDYIQFLAEGGPYLFMMPFVFAAMIFIAFWRRYRVAFKERHSGVFESPDFEWIAISLSIGVILVQASVNFLLYVPFVSLFLSVMGARLWGVHYQNEKVLQENPSKMSGGFRMFLGGLVFFIFSSMFGAQKYSYDVYQSYLSDRTAQQEFGDVEEGVLLASFINPIDHFSRYVLMRNSYEMAVTMSDVPFGVGFAELAWDDAQRFLAVIGRSCEAGVFKSKLVNQFAEGGFETKIAQYDSVGILEDTIKKFPSCSEAYLYLSKIYEERGLHPIAAKVLENYVKSATFPKTDTSGPIAVLAALSLLYLDLDHHDKAKRVAERVVQLDPNNRSSQYVLEQIRQNGL